MQFSVLKTVLKAFEDAIAEVSFNVRELQQIVVLSSHFIHVLSIQILPMINLIFQIHRILVSLQLFTFEEKLKLLDRLLEGLLFFQETFAS